MKDEKRKQITVWLVDDSEEYHKLVREALLESKEQMTLTSFLTSEEAFENLGQSELPQVILLGTMFRGRLSSLEVLSFFRRKITKCYIIMLSNHSDDDNFIKAMKEGANECIIKSANCKDLIQSITSRMNIGQTAFNVDRGSAIFSGEENEKLRKRYHLTPAEIKILQFIRRGYTTTKELSTGLNLSNDSIKYHLRKIYEKLGVKNINDL